jgi:hypothetical protein
MTKFISFIASFTLFAIPFVSFIEPVDSYSQDPRSCTDPRTQYPSNPPC